MKKLFLIIIIIFSTSAVFYSQHIGIGVAQPKATLDVQDIKKDGAIPVGVVPPKLTATQLKLNTKYGADQDRVVVYVSEIEDNPSGTIENIISPGYYYFDASNNKWESLGGSSKPWFSVEHKTNAIYNFENIYQLGQIGIGTSFPDPSAQLDIYSTSKGVLIPRLTTSDRKDISNPSQGLLFFNTTTKCLNYYNNKVNSWLSLCGDFGPAKYDIVNCDDVKVGASGTYTEGVPINYSNNTYTIIINVTKIGDYEIVGKTTNGYSFYKSGKFTSTGFHTIILEGAGKPVKSGEDEISLTFNNEEITPICTLPKIRVRPSEPTITIYCRGAKVNGVYKTGIALNGSHTITIPITEVVTPGEFGISATTTNGYSFSFSGNISSTTTSITLVGTGTPWNVQTDNLTLTPTKGNIIGVNNCAISVNVVLGLGGFENPAESCLEIYNATNEKSKDGEYWVKGDNDAPTKTLCDMTDGGYTLIWSYSEQTAFSNPVYNSQFLNTSISTYRTKLALIQDLPQQVVTSENGSISYNNYRLSSATMKKLSKSEKSGNKNKPNYLVRITENATSMTDPWAKLNYINIKITNSDYDLIYKNSGVEYSQGDQMNIEGKIFGAIFTRNGCVKTFNGVQITTGCISDPSLFTGLTGDFPNHINWSGQSANFTPVIPRGTADGTTYIPSSANLFGVFKVGLEPSPNHFFGKCDANGSETSFAIPACVEVFPHNSINNGEGRILQWFVREEL